jgi:pimeloyl-ACP methyl ester carboxylesterase
MIMLKYCFTIFLVSLIYLAPAQKEKITFLTYDSLEVTADIYLADDEYPFLILLHQEGSSRGEYNETALKFNKLNFNCLAVDLRSGNNSNYVRNETARKAWEEVKPSRFLDARNDIEAAIDYTYNLNNQDVILVGSSYSASLCMIIGNDNPHVKAVIAFSPGEFFGNDLRIEQVLDTFRIPLFVTGTETELPYITQMLQKISNQDNVTIFEPSIPPGEHGSMALWENNPTKDEYWLAILLFINSLKNI